MSGARVRAFLFVFLLSSLATSAQMSTPKPGAAQKKLDYFAGTWAVEGEMKPGPLGPGGKMTETEKSEWMDGGFFLVSHVDFTGSMGTGTGASVMGYDADEKVYTYDSYNSWGEAEHAKGTVEGDTWSWMSENKMGGQPMKTRFTIKQLSSTSYSFKFEAAGADGSWSTVMDGKATKQ